MAILAVLLGCQGIDEFKVQLPEALEAGVTPVQIKEIVYQAVDYLGMGRVRPFLSVTNEILQERGVKLPLESQSTATMDNRLEKGIEAQVKIFGEHMNEAWKAGHINRWLAANFNKGCFPVPAIYIPALVGVPLDLESIRTGMQVLVEKWCLILQKNSVKLIYSKYGFGRCCVRTYLIIFP